MHSSKGDIHWVDHVKLSMPLIKENGNGGHQPYLLHRPVWCKPITAIKHVISPLLVLIDAVGMAVTMVVGEGRLCREKILRFYCGGK